MIDRGERRYRLVLLALPRLSEAERDVVRALLDRVAAHADLLLVYRHDEPAPGELGAAVDGWNLVVVGEPADHAILTTTADNVPA